MDGLFSLLLFAGLFYLMMRFGCGAHMGHGHTGSQRHGEGGHGTSITMEHTDSVCGMTVAPDKGYEMMYEGRPYRFCSRACLDKFEANPTQYRPRLSRTA